MDWNIQYLKNINVTTIKPSKDFWVSMCVYTFLYVSNPQKILSEYVCVYICAVTYNFKIIQNMYMEEKGLRHFWRWRGLARTDSKNFHKIMVTKTVVLVQGQTKCSKE